MKNGLRGLASLLLLVLAGWSASLWADPPGRVGRISLVAGDVSFQNAHTGESEPAQVNWPVTAQNVIATGADGRVEVRIGSTAIRLDNDSELEFSRLDDEQIRIRLVAGRVALRVKNRDKLAEIEVRTPHGRVVFEDVGRYRFDTRGERDSSGVTVHQGAVRLDSGVRPVLITSGRRAEFWGAGRADNFMMTEALRDEFDDWNLARDQRDDGSRSVRYVSREMTGYDDLDEHGEWRDINDHGAVWIPHSTSVPTDWAPYRWGRWAWVDPWGWTWVDAAPWGFAPFHYGRWVHVHGVWGWAPGALAARPVYAPALVGWMGQPGAVSVSFGPTVGWFPLAPREVYYPAYPCTTVYVRRINVTHVHNVAVIQHNHSGVPTTPRRYHHAAMPHAVTMVAAGVVAGGRPVTPAVALARDHNTINALPIGNAPTMHAPPRPALNRVHSRPDGRTTEPRMNGQQGIAGGHRSGTEPMQSGVPRFGNAGGASQRHAISQPHSQNGSVPPATAGINRAGDPPATSHRLRGIQEQDGSNERSRRNDIQRDPPRGPAPIAIQQPVPMQQPVPIRQPVPIHQPVQIQQPRIEPQRPVAASRMEVPRAAPPTPAVSQQVAPAPGNARNNDGGPGQRRAHQGQPGQHRGNDGR